MESKNLKIYCITSEKINYLESLKLKIIVGGAHTNNQNFPKNWLLDSINENISPKNKNLWSIDNQL